MPKDFQAFLNDFPIRDFQDFQKNLVDVCKNLVSITREYPNIAKSLNSAVVQSIANLNPHNDANRLELICYATYLFTSPVPQIKADIERFLMNSLTIKNHAQCDAIMQSVICEIPGSYILVNRFIQGCLQQASFNMSEEDAGAFVWVNDTLPGEQQKIILHQDAEVTELLASSAKMIAFVVVALAQRLPVKEIQKEFLNWISSLYAFLAKHGIAAAEQLKRYKENIESGREELTFEGAVSVSGLFANSVSNLNNQDAVQESLPADNGASSRF